MARHGVDFETVKQAALKLLSKGVSPSVQRIRELLGTGSNSTIAEHLKIWREQHAAKKVHHLPASIPEELINTFETLWQTAMEHAEQHLTDVKESLNAQEEKLNQEKIIADKTIAELKSQHDSLNQKLDERIRENQALQTNLAVATERLQNQIEEINLLKQQHELRLTHLNNEKHQVIDQVSKLQSEIIQYKNELAEQTEKHQSMLTSERTLQEASEKRWVQLIDQARLETKSLQKKHDEVIQKLNDKIELLQSNLTKSQDALTTMHAALNHKNELISFQNKQLDKAQIDCKEAMNELSTLKSKLTFKTQKKYIQKHAEIV